MPVVTIDFETYYTSDYSLRKMSEVDYILSPLFQTIMCTVKVNDGPTEAFVGHDAVARKLSSFDWDKCAACSHNARFDMSILAWHFEIVPKLYLDTLSMARATTHAVAKRSSLDAVSKYLGLPDKGDEVVRAMGKRLEDFLASPQELAAYVSYCVRDTDNCRLIFNELRPHIPHAELRLIDSIIRMFVQPQVFLDANVLSTHLAQVRADKQAILNTVSHIDKSVFSSNQKFAALLMSKGVDVPQKVSPTTGELMPALAKNDRAFKELCDDPDQPLEIQALLAARVNSKSTMEETRTGALLNLSLREWGDKGTGWAPVPIKYYGAHTGRMSGDGGFNWLNFKRGSKIRGAIVAPERYRIVHRDSSQIEVRMLACLAGCEPMISAFRDGRDIYCEFASAVYGRPVTKAQPTLRFVGKTCILGLGYQTGGAKLRHTLFIGNGGVSVNVDEKEATDIVYKYRRMYPEIPELWAKGEDTLQNMMWLATSVTSAEARVQRANVLPVVTYDARALWLPNGMAIQYPNLRRDGRNPPGPFRDEILYDTPQGPTNIYGGKVTENVDQSLSRIVVTDIIDRVHTHTGYQPFLSTYDSIDYCVPVHEAAAFDEYLEGEFKIPPPWMPTLPLASEGGFGITLADAEHAVNQ